jgi:hypothetical protein
MKHTWFVYGLAVFLVLVGKGVAEVPFEEIRHVIVGYEKLGSARQEELYQAIEAGLADAQFGKDKQEHIAEHLATLLNDSIVGKEQCDAEEWHVILETTKWRAENYGALPEIDSGRREQGKQSLVIAARIAREFITREYEAIPAEIRDEIAGRAVAGILARQERVGNYFYPETVYALDAEAAEDAVRDALDGEGHLKAAVEDYQGIARILADESISEESKKAHVRMFVSRWGGYYTSVAKSVSQQPFSVGEARRNSIPMPRALAEAQQSLNEKKKAALKEQVAERRERRGLGALNNRLLLGTGIVIVDGEVVVDEDSVDDMIDRLSAGPEATAPAPSTQESVASPTVGTQPSGASRGETAEDTLKPWWIVCAVVGMLCVTGGIVAVVRLRGRKPKVS